MDHSKRPPTNKELEDAKSEKLAKVIDLIKSKKAEKEAARNSKQTGKKEERISKRQESFPFEAVPEKNNMHKKESHSSEDKSNRTTHDTHISDKKEPVSKQTSTSDVPEQHAPEEHEKNSPSSSSSEHTSPKEKLKIDSKDNITKKEEKENTHRQQAESAKDDINVTTEQEKKIPSHKDEHIEHYDRVDLNSNEPNNKDTHKQDVDKKLNINQTEHKVNTPKDEGAIQKDSKPEEDIQSKSIKKEKPEKFIPQESQQNEKDLHKADIKQDDIKVVDNNNNKSKTPKDSDASSAVYHDKKIPYHPQQPKSIDIEEIKAQVNDVPIDHTEPTTMTNDDMAEFTPTSIFTGYGIGQVDDEFGGLGLIGVFDGVASSANKSSISIQQLHIFIIITLFLTTWFMMHGRR